MAIPRCQLVDPACSELHHCLSRCVRRAFLLSEHDDRRRDWLIERLWLLTSCYAIDVVALAVMSNHFHLLSRTLPEVVAGWSDAEVAYRWILLHPQRRQRRALGIDFDAVPQPIEIERLLANPTAIKACRRKLGSLSSFMKDLKQAIAVRANLEDEVQGHFWESRFKSHRILDEAATLLCAAYIDMNPVRAGMAQSALLASHTSVAEHARRLWHEVGHEVGRAAAKAPEDAPDSAVSDACSGAEAPRDSREALDAFVASLQDAVFIPAMPARREPWTADEEKSGQDGKPDAVAAAPPNIHAEPVHEPAPATLRQPRSSPETRATTRTEAATAPRRSTSPVRMMGLTLGGYLRRLRELSERVACSRKVGSGRALERDRAAPASVEELLDDPGRIDELVDLATRWLDMCGTAIGSTAARAAEAVRRKLVGRERVGLAFELLPIEPPGREGPSAAGSPRR